MKVSPPIPSLTTILFRRHTLSPGILRYVSIFGLLGLLVATLLITGCTPNANLQADVTSGAAPLTVNFNNTTSAFLSKADEFRWDFGDGATANTTTKDEAVTHEFTKAGNNTVTLTALKGNPPKVTSTRTLVINVEHGALSAIKITPPQAEMTIGQTQEFEAIAVDAYDNPIPEASFNWTADSATGTLASNTFTAGTKADTFDRGIVATASLGSNTTESSVAVTVKPDPMNAVEIPRTEVAAGDTQQLLVAATDRYGNRIESGLTKIWTGTNDDAGSISSEGMFTANKVAGTFTKAVKVKVTQGDKTLEAEAPLTVIPGKLDQVVIGPGKAEIGMGMTQQFVAVGADQYGNRISGLKFTWVLDGSGTVGSDGLFTAGNDTGNFTIQAQATQADVTKFAKTSVNVLPDRIAYVSEGFMGFLRKKDDKQFDVYVMNSDGSGNKRLTSTSTPEFSLSASADGRRIVYDSFDRDDGIMAMNDQGKWLSQIVANDDDFAWVYPQLSPDGSKIVMNKLDLNKITKDIFIVDADGSNLKQLTNTPNDEEWPASWSPDGTRLVYSVNVGDEPGTIWVMNADGSGKKRLTPATLTSGHPAWSPDGTRIAFTQVSSSGYSHIYVMNADGSNVTLLTKNASVDDVKPSWSPDGRKIVYISGSDEKSEVWVVDADGKNATKITLNLGEDDSAIWLPRKAGVEVTEDSIVIPDASKLRDLTVQEITNRSKAAVVRIKTDSGSGSGFFISPDGQILTANHVISGAKEITVYLTNGTNYKATVKSKDIVRDLAIIEIKATGLTYLEFGDLSRVGLGQPVMVLGYPLENESVSVTSGLVSTIDYDGGRNISWVQTDSAINPGNSGGPLLNLRGQVIGMVDMKMVGIGVEGVGFAISANTINIYLPPMKN